MYWSVLHQTVRAYKTRATTTARIVTVQRQNKPPSTTQEADVEVKSLRKNQGSQTKYRGGQAKAESEIHRQGQKNKSHQDQKTNGQ